MTRAHFAIALERCWFRACRAAQKFIRTITGDNR